MMRSFGRDRRGNFAITSAVAMLPIMGLGGAALDYASLNNYRSGTQEALDATVLAMMTDGKKTIVGKNATGLNFFAAKPGNPCSSRPTFTYDTDLREVTGKVSCTMPTSFLGIIGTTSLTMTIEAKAVIGQKQGAACVIALDPTSRKALTVSGNGSIEIPDCGVYVNSSDHLAMQITGNGLLNAQRTWVVGGYGGNVSPVPTTGSDPAPDPYAGVPEPHPSKAGCDYKSTRTTQGKKTKSEPVVFNTPMVFPANTVFCGDIEFNASVLFMPGTHYFMPYDAYGAAINGDTSMVSIGSNVSLVGAGVLLYFGQNVAFEKTTGNGIVNLSASTTGPYKGVAIFSSRLTAANTPFIMRGTPSFTIEGSIYTPTMAYDMKGDASVTVPSKTGYVIANQFAYSGSASLIMQAFGGIVPWSTSEDYVRLAR